MRLPAEWEKQEALLISYPHKDSDWSKYLDEAKEVFDRFIETVSRYQKVIILGKERPKRDFKNSEFIKVDTNDTWIRDYGPITVFEKNEKKLLDFTFNGWGLKYSANFDNLVNRKVFKTKKIPFVLEGGSIDTNGDGVLLTTSKCLLEANRNPHLNREEIERKLKEFFGLKKILWLNSGFLIGDDTDSHIDMLARFVDKKTIVYMSCDDKNDPHFKELKKMEEEIKSFGFETIALPWISPKYYDSRRLPASYANFVIINGAVIVPTYNDKNDKEALKIFKSIFKDRDVVGLDASILIRENGSLHCSCINLF